MMALVEVLGQQVIVANKALEEARAELNSKIMELRKENQVLREVQKGAYDPFNPEMEQNELNNKVNRQEVEQLKQKAPIQRMVEEAVSVRSNNHSHKQRKLKIEVQEDQKTLIIAKMAKKMGSY